MSNFAKGRAKARQAIANRMQNTEVTNDWVEEEITCHSGFCLVRLNTGDWYVRRAGKTVGGPFSTQIAARDSL
jgi:hypothetical protein